MNEAQTIALTIFALACLWSITSVILALVGKRRDKDQ